MIIAPMSLHRLYCPDLKMGPNTLPPEESHHATASLRAQPGDEFVVFDGRGREASARVDRVTRKQVQVLVERITDRPFDLRHKITLAVAMTRVHRQGYLVEKCTELGVAAFWPILAERSVARPSSDSTEKWSRRAIEAAKQSGRAWVPTVKDPQTFAQALARIREFSAAAIADPGCASTPITSFLSNQGDGSSLLIFIGPEGGWSEDECRTAGLAGVAPVRLSPTVLRSETAAVTACAAAALCSASKGMTTRPTIHS